VSTSLTRDRAAVRIFPPALPLAAILLGIALQRWWPLRLGFDFPRPERYWVGGSLILLSILLLGLWSVVLFRQSGESENPWKPTYRVVERGPYRVTRNPMYLQMVLISIGAFIMLMNWWILLLTPLVAWGLQEWAIKPEEAYLEQKFGEQYISFKRRVRRWL
jgi:protein-S-isoprenylcysteine O-methyltransferase Ste14